MYIGLDIGGTKMLGGAFNGQSLSKTHKIKTPSSASAQAITDQIILLIQTLAQKEKIEGIGIGIPGSIDAGVIHFSPNLPFRDFPLLDHLKARFQVPIAIANDVNAGLLGEHWAGAARSLQNVIGLFIGTGIGGALILNNRLHSGLHQIAGEIGHMKLRLDGTPCNCGETGCFEALASKTGIQRVLEKNGFSFDGVVKSSFLREQMEKDNKVVKTLMKKVATTIGEAIGSLTNVLDPEAFILGGGVMQSLGSVLLPRIKSVAKSRGLVRPVIKLSALGDYAVVHGAVRLVLSQNH